MKSARAPTCIISDGPYGVSGFPGDEHKAEALLKWYEPHIKAWTRYASPETTLWFWSTELGWATVHPLLLASGWEEYVAAEIVAEFFQAATERPCAQP